jgi:hypothetical protein
MKLAHNDSPWFWLALVLSLLFSVLVLLLASGVIK